MCLLRKKGEQKMCKGKRVSINSSRLEGESLGKSRIARNGHLKFSLCSYDGHVLFVRLTERNCCDRRLQIIFFPLPQRHVFMHINRKKNGILNITIISKQATNTMGPQFDVTNTETSQNTVLRKNKI